MRWLILALSLGTTLATLYRGIMPLMFYVTNAGVARLTGLWPSIIMLCLASVFGFIGGILSFNQKKLGALFLFIASILAYFGYPAGGMMALAFVTIAVMSIAILFFTERAERINERGHSRSRYDEEEDEEEEEIHDEDEDSDDDEEGGLRRTTLKFRMPPRRTYSPTPQRETPPEPEQPVPAKPTHSKSKYSKVCLNCGVDVPREHGFCFSCGAKMDDRMFPPQPLPQPPEEQARQPEQNYDDYQEYDEEQIAYRPPQRQPFNPAVEVVPVIRKISAPEIPRNFAPDDIPQEDDVPFRPAAYKKKRSYEADSSYQSFGRYAQSRKKRRVSTLQRVLLGTLGFGVAAALGWFMYMGISRVGRDVPPPPVEVPQPRVVPVPEPEPKDEEPVVPPNGVPAANLLPAMAAETPRQVATTGPVNLRADHTTTSRAIGRLPAGATYELLDQWQTNNPSSLPATDKNLTAKWYQVRAGDSRGWIYSQYAQPIDGRAVSLPSGYTDALLSSFGATREEIEAKLGKPTKVQTRGDVVSLEYPGARISLRDRKVQSLQITGREVTLANGLAVGMTFEETMDLIGAPNRYRDGVQLFLETPTRGIVIRRGTDGKIRNINVGNA